MRMPFLPLSCPGIAGAMLFLATAAARPAEANECSTSRVNRDCLIVIAREAPSAPLPIHVWPGAKVTIRVTRRPLEAVIYETVLTDFAAPDPLAAIFGSFVTPLKTLVASQQLDVGPFRALSDRTPAELDAKLTQIDTLQRAVRLELQKFKERVDAAGDQLRAVRERPAGWEPAWFAQQRTALICLITAEDPTPPACAGVAVPGIGVVVLPAGSVAALAEAMEEVVKVYEGLPLPVQQALKDRLNIVADNQRALTQSLTSLQESRTGLRQAAEIFKKINPAAVQPFAERVFVADPNGVARMATVKLTARDILSRENLTLTTVIIRWGATRWELSGGGLFSAMPNRTFANAPIIDDGVPRLDAAGKVFTRVTETTTRPSVVPMFLAHYRLAESEIKSQRIAFLVSCGIGISPYSGSADFAAGVTVSYRGFMVSPVIHWGRALRLTNGLEPGLELGTSPPALTAERHWDKKAGVVLSYRIPIN